MLVHHVPVSAAVLDEPVAVEQVVNASQNLSAQRHLEIYRYSYIARLRSCMQSQFAALAYALGSQLFEAFADQYLDVYPSESYTLNTLGEQFPKFLEETRPDAHQQEKETWPDFMIELATFEYQLSQIFDEHTADNSNPATADTPDDLLQLAPVLHLFHQQFPICEYYLQYSQGKEPELPFPEESYCVVTRRNYKLGLFTIRPAQYHFLSFMKQGRSVSEARDELLQTFGFERPEVDRVWPLWKQSFIESGFLTT